MTSLPFVVTAADTARALGSGDVDVLGTPRLLAWMEAATVQAAVEHLVAGQTSVGVEVHLRHRRPSALGQEVLVEVVGVQAQGRRLVFDVHAWNAAGADAGPAQPREQAAWASITRVVVPA